MPTAPTAFAAESFTPHTAVACTRKLMDEWELALIRQTFRWLLCVVVVIPSGGITRIRFLGPRERSVPHDLSPPAWRAPRN